MRKSEFITERAEIANAKKAYANLSYEAKHAIDSWESMNWVGGALEKHIQNNDEVAQNIEQAFKPVRDAIPGSTITLYRGLRSKTHVNNWGEKTLESWTSDKHVAEYFADLRTDQNKSGRLRQFKVFTQQEIDDAVQKYEQAGYVKFNNKYYIKNKEHPKYYNIYDRHRQLITDGDNLRREFEEENAYRIEQNEKSASAGKVIKKEVDKNDIIWISNNLNSKEFIVKKQDISNETD